MTTKINALLMATAFFLSTAAIAAHAADGSAFEQKLEQSDGDVATTPAPQAKPRTNTESPWAAAQTAWFERERAQPTIAVPYVPPKATTTAVATDSPTRDSAAGQ